MRSLNKRDAGLRWLPVLIVLAIAAAAALPHYIHGSWPWQTPPPTPHLEQLKALRQSGLPLPGWQTLPHPAITLSGHRWTVQGLQPQSPAGPPGPPVLLLLRPQMQPGEQPQADWVSFHSELQLSADLQQRLPFTAQTGSQTARVSAQLQRYRSVTQTYAALQWYAWPTGGSANLQDWFWADQQRQWRDRQRSPWVAVCLLIPIEPLADFAAAYPVATNLGQTVQGALMRGVFGVGKGVRGKG